MRLIRLAVLLLLSTSVHAADIGRVPRLCPCCGRELNIPLVMHLDRAGGVDRDLFARSREGAQQVFYYAVTCPTCLFTGYERDFLPHGSRVPVFTTAQREAIDRAIDPMRERLKHITPESDILELTGQQRYELLYRINTARERSHQSQAWTALRLSWCWRQEMCALPKRERYVFMVKALRSSVPQPKDNNTADRGIIMANLASDPREVTGETTADRLIRRFMGAYLYRRHGELLRYEAVRDSLFAEMREAEQDIARRNAASDPDSQVVTDWIATLRKDLARLTSTLADERKWQDIAVKHFEQSVHGGDFKQGDGNRVVAIYLIAELHRRRGRRSLALQWFDHAARQNLPPRLKGWVTEQRALAVELPRDDPPKPASSQPTSQPTTGAAR